MLNVTSRTQTLLIIKGYHEIQAQGIEAIYMFCSSQLCYVQQK